jgi:hypothetical protein
VDKSVYIVPMEKLDEVKGYLDRWGQRIRYRIFKVLIEPDKFKKVHSKQFQETESEWTEVPVE